MKLEFIALSPGTGHNRITRRFSKNVRFFPAVAK